MEKTGFIYLKCSKEAFEDFPWYVRLGPWKEKRKTRYLERAFPIQIGEKTILGFRGVEVEIPATLLQTGNFQERLQGALKEYEEAPIVCEEGHIAGKEKFRRVCDGTILPVLYAKEIIGEILERKNRKASEVRLVLVMGKKREGAFLLRLLGSTYNYVSVAWEGDAVSDEGDAVSDEATWKSGTVSEEVAGEIERLYEEYGLVVPVCDTKNAESFRGDIILDLTGNLKQYCRNIPKGCAVVDFSEKQDLRYLESRCKEVTFYRSFSFGIEDEMPKALIEAALVGSRMAEGDTYSENLWEWFEKLRSLEVRLLAVNGEKIKGIS